MSSVFKLLLSISKSNLFLHKSLLITGIILLKLIIPKLPLSILKKSILVFILLCFSFGEDNGAKYSLLFTLKTIPINGLFAFNETLFS